MMLVMKEKDDDVIWVRAVVNKVDTTSSGIFLEIT
jgi:hypothetical protein